MDALTFTKYFMQIIPGETPPSGELNTRGVALAQWAFYKKGLSA